MRGSVALARRPVLLASAGLAVLAGLFAAGFAIARHGGGQGGAPVAVVSLEATAAAPGASGRLQIGPPDGAGNRPVTLRVSKLPRLQAGSYYELYLTRGGRPAAWVGPFTVRRGAVTVHLNDAREPSAFDGWAVVGERAGGAHAGTVVLAGRSP